jgi:hypothetical protein
LVIRRQKLSDAPCFEHGASFLSAPLTQFVQAETRLMRLSTPTIAIAALVAPIASANAVPPVRAGILECHGGENVGYIVGSMSSLECVFQSEGRRPEPHIATVRRFGLDFGITD